MKKIIIFFGVIIVSFLVLQRSPFHFEELFAKISDTLSKQNWELDGKYNIDETDWFDKDREVFSGKLPYTQLGERNAECLRIKAAGCRVEIVRSEEENCYFEFTNMKKVQAYQKDSTVIVNAMRDTKWEQEDEDSVLKLYIPQEQTFKMVEIELGAGALHMEELLVDSLDISLEAGKLTTDGLCAGQVEIELGAGDILLAGSVLGDVDIDCAAGNVEVILKGQPADFNYKLQCVAGNIQIGEEKYTGINEEKEIDNMAHKTMNLECAVGNIFVKYES